MQSPFTWLAVCAVAAPLAAAAAEPPLLPTAVRGSDCIAVQITALSLPGTTFFTDHCAGPDDPVFIGLSGREYPLKRSEGDYNAFPFQGKFVGEGLVVVVKPIRLLQREPRSKESNSKDDYRPSKFEVLVTVSHGQAKRSFSGVMSQ